MRFHWTASRYIFFELLPGFFLGVLIFIFILLSFQVLRLTEFVLLHGVDLTTIGKIMGFLTVSFLPAVLPMSLLFSILLGFSRLSNDSEIVALKACGLSMFHMALPAVLLGVLIAIFSANTSFDWAPWGNRQFEVLITKLGTAKAAANIREGTFSEGFFDMVVYANRVDSKQNTLEDVFIFDEREPKSPVTIIAKGGRIVPNEQDPRKGALLRLNRGNIHRTQEDTYTRVDFESYDINLMRPLQEAFLEKTTLSLTLRDLIERKDDLSLSLEKRREYQSEFHKRWAIAVACLIFSLLGVSLGTVANRRGAKSNSLLISLGIIVTYWIFYVLGDNFARQGVLPPWLAIWSANFIFSILGIHFFRKSWN